MPIRIRLSRKAGFNLQEYSRSINGLEAVNVARPSKWGNPYRVDYTIIHNAETAVRLYQRYHPVPLDLSELRGKNLACWCGEDEPCHADILLRLANEGT